MRASILTLLFACCFSLDVVAVDASHSYALYLIRHAEKQLDGSSDPGLTEAGKHRSEQLAKWFQDKDIEDIWSSDYRRTRDTAKPLVSTVIATDRMVQYLLNWPFSIHAEIPCHRQVDGCQQRKYIQVVLMLRN